MISPEQTAEVARWAGSLTEKRTDPPPLLFTNAPSHWPRVSGLHFRKEAHIPARTSILEVHVFGALAGAKVEDFRIARLAASHLMDEGELYYSCQVDDRGKLTPVVVYPEGHPNASAHFAGLSNAASRADLAPPVYYSQVGMQKAVPLNVFRALGPHSFYVKKDAVEKGEYAMWWTTPEDPDLVSSATGKDLDAYHEAIEGYQSYWLAWFLARLEVVKKARRVALPEEGFSVKMTGPEGRTVILSASAEKGVRFHLPMTTTPTTYRDRFFRHLAEAAKGMRRELERVGAPKDPDNEHSPLRVWKMTRGQPLVVDGKPLTPTAAAVFIIR